MVGVLMSALGGPVQADAEDATITLHIGNEAPETLRCVVLFAHWVTRDLGAIDIGSVRALAVMRDARDAALYLSEADGRKMMIENIVCGTDGAWSETLGQLPLLQVRKSREQALRMSCELADRVVCIMSDLP
jgi:hypothetical protein